MGKKTSKAMKGISCALAAVIFGLGAAALATKGSAHLKEKACRRLSVIPAARYSGTGPETVCV